MKWIVNPTAWVGLISLIVLEIILGIDNLVFITLLANKLPTKLCNKAKIIGLTCALFMRIILLFSLTLLVSLTNPIVNIYDHQFSMRDILMLSGGFFLLFKITIEFNKRLEGKNKQSNKQHKTTKLWVIIAQIIILDTIFSIDSIITAVGIVKDIEIMITAVIITTILMIIASKPLTIFVKTNPTIIILCFSFLIMISFNLIAEGLGYQIPKGYLYSAIAFSIIIELINKFTYFKWYYFCKRVKMLQEKLLK